MMESDKMAGAALLSHLPTFLSSSSSRSAIPPADETAPLLAYPDSDTSTGSMGVDPSPRVHEEPSKPGVVDDAALAEAIAFEHNLTFAEALKLYPAAIGWSAFVSIGVIMLAFDPQLLGNLYATPQFQSTSFPVHVR